MNKRKSRDSSPEMVTRVSLPSFTWGSHPQTMKPSTLVLSWMKPSRVLLRRLSSSFPFTSCLHLWRWLPQRQFKSRVKISLLFPTTTSFISSHLFLQIPVILLFPLLPSLLRFHPQARLHSCVKLTSVSLHATWLGIKVDTNLILLCIPSSRLSLLDFMEERRQWVNWSFSGSGLLVKMEVV